MTATVVAPEPPTTLDVEWVHAVAPGAKIILVVTADNSCGSQRS
jgi:subtilase family serine protease